MSIDHFCCCENCACVAMHFHHDVVHVSSRTMCNWHDCAVVTVAMCSNDSLHFLDHYSNDSFAVDDDDDDVFVGSEPVKLHYFGCCVWTQSIVD